MHLHHHREIGNRQPNQQHQKNHFRHIDERPWDVTVATIPAAYKVEYREQPQESTWHPNQHGLFKADCEIRIRFGPTQLAVLKIDFMLITKQLFHYLSFALSRRAELCVSRTRLKRFLIDEIVRVAP